MNLPKHKCKQCFNMTTGFDSAQIYHVLIFCGGGGCNCKSDRAFKFVFASERCVNEPQVVSCSGDGNKRRQGVTIHNTFVVS